MQTSTFNPIWGHLYLVLDTKYAVTQSPPTDFEHHFHEAIGPNTVSCFIKALLLCLCTGHATSHLWCFWLQLIGMLHMLVSNGMIGCSASFCENSNL